MADARVTVLIEGAPVASPSNGGMGWSTVGLVEVDDRRILIDTGPMGARDLLRTRLAEAGTEPESVTDVVLTHLHHDHAINWMMFPRARVYVGQTELQWARQVPAGSSPIAELYVRELAASPQLVVLADQDEITRGVTTDLYSGHTPGHLIVTIDRGSVRTIFASDVVKYRAELIEGRALGNPDEPASARSIERIWQLWRQRPGTVLVPGHDLPMDLVDGRPHYLGDRSAQVIARLGERLDDITRFPLIDPKD